ncbi:MAG TPA: Flp pilus assembly protein CpaB [Gemmataceae bacterium]|jgi:pilus assembly protein CpaB|nr:Flp pilus assembly protein CpaB [Gemmataceae bacterium]
MKQRNMILLALAVGFGLVAAFLTAKLGASNKVEMVPVLVAAKNLNQGDKLEKPEELFVRKPFPKESVPPEFVDDLSLLKGKTLQRTIHAGTHVTQDDITPDTGIALPIDPKTGDRFKAMAIKASVENAVAGLIKPGSHVDIITVERLPSGKTTSTLLLQNVLVVAMNDETTRKEQPGTIKSLTTVTVAVKQSEGLMLGLACKRGDIYLMLRDPGDDRTTNKTKKIEGYDVAEDSSGGNVEMMKAPVAKKIVPAGTKIENPADFFDEEDWPVSRVPENAIAKMDELKGKTVTRDIFPNSFVFKEAFDGDVKRTVVPTDVPRGNETRMVIQYGSNPPTTHRFINGTLITDGAPPPEPESKPEEKNKDKEKD